MERRQVVRLRSTYHPSEDEMQRFFSNETQQPFPGELQRSSLEEPQFPSPGGPQRFAPDELQLPFPGVSQSSLPTAPLPFMGEPLHSNPGGPFSVQIKRWRPNKLHVLFFGLLLCLVLGSTVLSIGTYQMYQGMYHKDVTLAETGIQHLQKAESLLATLSKNPFEAATVNQAQHEFSSALTALNQLNNELKMLPGFSSLLPVYGSRLSAALHLLPLAITLSQVGITASALLTMIIARFHDPFSLKGQGFTTSDLVLIGQDLRQMQSALDLVAHDQSRLQPADVQSDPRVGPLLSKLRKGLPALQSAISSAERLLSFAPALLGVGTPANYLVEILDSTELRPGGGFIGNYGIASLSGGRLTAAHISDAYLLDRPFVADGKSISYPSSYSWFPLAPASWSFRDSNLDADFPTAARYGERDYRLEGGKVPVQGVIAITPAFIQQAMAITGPIKVPEYNEVVTPQNLITLIHFHQLGGALAGQSSSLTPATDVNSSQRKHFIALLAENFLTRVRQLGPTAIPRFLQLVTFSMRSKDVQIYFNSDAAEQYLAQQHLNASIQQPPGDSFMVVDANVSPNKANSVIINNLNDEVAIDEQGDVTHHTTLTYAWPANKTSYGASLYRDYVRIYVPTTSSLLAQEGWQYQGKSTAFGHEVWAGWFNLLQGQTRAITLTWTVPHGVGSSGNDRNYLYTLQRQAGSHWIVHVQMAFPTCAVLTRTKEGQLAYGDQTATLSQPFNEDLKLDLKYTCK